MPINPDAVGAVGEESEVAWTSDDSLLYALGVGAGASDPTGFELEFTTENTRDLPQRALPTQVVVMGMGAMPDYGDFDLAALLHGDQHIELHQELPPAGSAVSQTRLAGIYDKIKAALVVLETNARSHDGEPLWTSRAGLFISGEGGWGGDRGPSSTWQRPDRPADHVTGYDTRTDQALLYRLNGDRNPLHTDPSFSALAGFETPILHGLCTFGVAGRALLHTCCASDPARFASMSGRFKMPVLPGQRLDVHIWDEGDQTLFQTRVGDQVVFDAGVFTAREV
ncbi:MAG: MaoC/PaaZ C-terminal domain-containing protein [Acidimicrobiaceae bacterium]|nr:MaoC/PaaZ C-terminal domain-containing protein [Acidimicrobiaceae bacterium]